MPESTKPSKPRKARKTQAVKATNNTAIKAIMKRNAANSFLLKAPTEVLDTILKLVLGNQMIHIKFLSSDSLEDLLISESKDPKTTPEDGGLCAGFCVAKKSEQAAYNEANHGVQVSEDPNLIETCKERHETCVMWSKHDKANLVTGLQGERLTFDNNLSVLGVCRQLYEQSNSILWESNTFSFDDPKSFTRFVGSMNPAQKAKLRKIHLSLNVRIDYWSRWLLEDWTKATSGRILIPLKSVKTLHLTFDQYQYSSTSYGPKDKVPHTTSQRWVNEYMNQMLGLRMLPWKHKQDAHQGKYVTVIIADDDSTHAEAITPRWSKAAKLKIAEAFRALLADPNSVETHRADAAAAKIAAAERKLREEKQERIDKLQDAIDDLRPRVKRAKDEYEWRQVDREMAQDKDKNPLKKYAPISDYQRFTAIGSAKKRFDELDFKLYCLKDDLKSVRKDPKYLSLKKPGEDSSDDPVDSDDDQDEEGPLEDGTTSPITANEFIRWLKAPIPY